MELARRGRVRQWLSADGPASRGTQLFLFVSALLCGAALAALLFVGVWRHTAGEAARTRDAQVGEHRALVATRQELAALRTRFRNDQALLAKARRAHADAAAALEETRNTLTKAQHALTTAQRALVTTRSADTAARRALTGRAEALAAAAGSLVRQTTTLRSELGALETYALAPGATGVDPGYIASQARYLLAAASSAVSSAEDLSGRAQALGAG